MTAQTKQDYYELLGVSRDADAQEIKKAFRKMAVKYHPDRNPGDAKAEEQFKIVAEAYEVLSDPEKRSRYDKFGHSMGAGQGFGGFNFDFSQFSRSSAFSDIFGDLFGDMFGGNFGGRRAAYRGRDLRYDLEITLEEAASGGGREIEVPRSVTCETCHGSGAKPGTSPQTCRQCGGRGQVQIQQGFFTIARTCPRCNGAGQIIADPCPDCRGTGKTAVKSKIKITLPAGIDHGQKLKISGEGEAGKEGAPPGDLYVVVHLKPHDLFQRHEDDIVLDMPISFGQAALGARIQVPTLDGPTSLKIAAGTQSGEVFRLQGKGIQHLGGFGKGDMHVRISVEVPRNLTKEQKKLIEQFDKSCCDSGEKNQPNITGFFEKLKDFLAGD